MQPQRYRGTEANSSALRFRTQRSFFKFFYSLILRSLGIGWTNAWASVPLWLILVFGSLASAQTQRAVDRGLEFLVKTQNRDGSFGRSKDASDRARETSFCLLAFISAGDGPDLGNFGSPVRAAANYLLDADVSRMSAKSRRAVRAALSELAGVDDNPADQAKIAQLIGSAVDEPRPIPFRGKFSDAVKTIRDLRSGAGVPERICYSALYCAAIWSASIRCDAVTDRVDPFVIAQQGANGSWGENAESTAMAILAMTAEQRLMPMGG